MSISSREVPAGSCLLAHLRRQSSNGAGNRARIERAQIVDPFADADGVDRKAEFLRRSHQHAAARGAVELGHDQSGHAGTLARTPRSG